MTDRQASGAAPAKYRMVLFVAGDGPNSRAAKANLAAVCQEDLSGSCETEVVDVFEQYERAAKHSILVTPALVVTEPPMGMVLLGNLNDRDCVRGALRLEGA